MTSWTEDFFDPLPGSSPLLPVSVGSGAERNRECNLTWSLNAGTLFQYLAVLGIARFPLDSLGGGPKMSYLVWCSWEAKHKININFNHSDVELSIAYSTQYRTWHIWYVGKLALLWHTVVYNSIHLHLIVYKNIISQGLKKYQKV